MGTPLHLFKDGTEKLGQSMRDLARDLAVHHAKCPKCLARYGPQTAEDVLWEIQCRSSGPRPTAKDWELPPPRE